MYKPGRVVGSMRTAKVFEKKLSNVENGYQLKAKDFKPKVEPAPFNNGLKGAYVVQCRKLVFSYCETGGSSKGISEYIKKYLVDFAKSNPQIEIIVKQQPWNHPTIEGFYMNGRNKLVTVANLDVPQIRVNTEGLKSSLGGQSTDYRKYRVLSNNQSIRGIWSPFHTEPHKV